MSDGMVIEQMDEINRYFELKRPVIAGESELTNGLKYIAFRTETKKEKMYKVMQYDKFGAAHEVNTCKTVL